MKPWLLAWAALLLCGGQARADQADGAARDPRWSFSVTEENDAWNFKPDHTDRNYTQGLQAALMAPEFDATRGLPAPFRMFCLLEHGGEGCNGGQGRDLAKDPVRLRWGVELGQNIYTPTQKTSAVDLTDRPYAGWLYGGVLFGSYTAQQANTLELQVGVVGPHAYAGEVQSYWHHTVLKIPIFEGWTHQLHDEVAFVAVGERRWAPDVLKQGSGAWAGWAVDSPKYVDFSVGTVRDSISTGRMLRFGYGLDSDFGPSRIRPAPSGSVFVDAEAVARDIFLDGNTFRGSPRVKKRWLVGEGTIGAEFRWRGVRVAYTYVGQTEEFYSQRTPQHFTSLNATLNLWPFWR